MSEEIQKLLPYSCKVEAHKDYITLETRCYHDEGPRAVREAYAMFKLGKELLEKDGFKVAPLDVKER